MFFTNGGTVPLLITSSIPRLHRAIRVVETSQLLQLLIMIGSWVLSSGRPSDPLPRLIRRRGLWSERQSAHLKPMGLRKCHSITVKPLIDRGYQNHPSTLTNFLPEEHSIHNRDISQKLFSGIMTNTNNLWGRWEGKTIQCWPSLMTMINTFFQRVGHQWRSSLRWATLVPFLPIPFSSPALYWYTRTMLYPYIPVRISWGNLFRFPSLNIFTVLHALSSPSEYLSLEVRSWVSHFTPDTTEPIGSP